MLFNDPLFLFIFLPAALCASIVARRLWGARAVLGVLVLASIVFYGWWNPIYLPLLGGLALFNFVFARWIVAALMAKRRSRVRLLLTIGIVVDLAVLAYFKYTDFFIGTANTLLGQAIPLEHILLPLGISFFTFQKIAYLVDASRGAVTKHSFLEYCFFVMFFPQLIAGPIVHHSEIFSQIRRPGALAVQPDHVAVGLTIFLIGLFKKVIIADHLAPVVSEVFTAADIGQPLSLFMAWQGAAAYTLQLYFDFSGYSDMAIGAARLFGIRLPLNFHSPYQSTNIIEFWRRWHMTLSRFLRDYLYFPLGGNRKGKARRYLNLILTMTIGGLWHGAWWNFVLWGFLHGAYLAVNHAWRGIWTPIDRWWSRGIARLVTLALVVIAFVIFRAPNLVAAHRIYWGMLGSPENLLPTLAPAATNLAALDGDLDRASIVTALVWGVASLAVLWFLPNTQQFMARFQPAINFGLAAWHSDPPLLFGRVAGGSLLWWRPGIVGAAFIGLLAALAFLSLQHVSEFLYFEF
ncbi:MAG TPA: MBOAT family protein [Stellaceae bacterium]|nr:MBOAT family protein [Stellaceae bacterium]